MTTHALTCQPWPVEDLPLALLLLADPCQDRVHQYLPHCQALALVDDGQVLGAVLLLALEPDRVELINLAVAEEYQQQGLGTCLLKGAIAWVREQGAQWLELGTGAFGHQLAFYQRQGFRVTGILKDHFIDHYPEPIYELGIQHKDMLRLSLPLRSPGDH